MVNPLTLVLLEDDPSECKEFEEYIETTKSVHLVGIADSADKALEYVKDNLPDAVILELDLIRGSGTGLDFLEGLKASQLPVTPYKLVATYNQSAIILKWARYQGADFTMVKRHNGCNARVAIDFLIKNKAQICNSRLKNRGNIDLSIASFSGRRKRLVKRISTEMNLIGISPKVIGREYLVAAITYVVEGNRDYKKIIAKEYGKSEASVEQALRNAVNTTWAKTAPDILLKHYTNYISKERCAPTYNEFIYHYANNLKFEYDF